MTTEKQHFPLVRTIYLYLFALVGLALLSIGVVRMVDLGLKALIFTGADESQRTYARQPVPALVAPERLDKVQTSADLTAEEKASAQAMAGGLQDLAGDAGQARPGARAAAEGCLDQPGVDHRRASAVPLPLGDHPQGDGAQRTGFVVTVP